MDGARRSTSVHDERLAGPAAPARSGDWARPHYQPLALVFAAAAAGMVLDRYGRPAGFLAAAGGSTWFLAWSGLCACSLGVWWWAWRRRRDTVAAWLLMASAAALGAAWHHFNWSLYGELEIGRYAADEPAPACIEAVARESPERVAAPSPTPLRAIPTSERSRFVVDLTAIRDGRSWLAASGICQISLEGHLLGVRPGDTLRVYGQLARPASPLNGGEFDFAAHARADRLLARVRSTAPECVVRLAGGSAWSPRYWLDSLRARARHYVRSMVGERRAGLAAAILLGAREGLPYEETEPYLETGTIHVLVVSGMNVAILAIGLLAFMRMGWLPRRIGLCVIMAIVAGYTLLAESQPPVMRAAVLGILGCIAIWIGRRGVAFNSIFAAALVVLAINPNDLFRVGPQLSFLAVAVLIWCGHWALHDRQSMDPLEQLLESVAPWHERAKSRIKRWALALLLTSLAVWLVTLPLVLATYHIVSPIAVPVSLIIWPLVTVAMWSGLFMVAVGWLWPPVGHVCGSICGGSLAGLETVVQWAEAVPGGHFWAPGPAWWWVVIFYVVVLGVMVRGTAALSLRWQVAALAVWVLVGVVPPLVRGWTRDGLDCSFVAVGHGACVVLEGPDGETLVYDAGAIGSPQYATYAIASQLWHRGIMRIDGLVISHADIDHYNAVPGLLERFRVGTVYVSPVMLAEFRHPNAAEGVKLLHAAIARAGVPIREIWSGDRLRIGAEVSARVFHPPRLGVVGSDNANSITLAVEYAGRRILLPGDLESPGLEDVIAEAPYNCDLLLAPHHGSRRSDPPGFAAWSTPNWVVVSGGGDDVEPVRRAYTRAGANVLATKETGTISFRIAAERGLAIATHRRPNEIGRRPNGEP
jgi:competence protein ComEC